MTAPLNSQPLPTLWERTLREHGDRAAILAADGRVERRFSDIETESLELADRLPDAEAGGVAAVQIGNSPAWPAVLLALARRGMVPLPLGGHLGEAELQDILALSGARLIIRSQARVFHTPPRPVMLRHEASLIISGAEGENSRRSFVPQDDTPAEVHGEWKIGADFLKLTSGTTTAPRLIRFRWAQLVADCESICDTMGITADDLNFGLIPISHSYGFSNLVTPLICRGVPMVATEERLPRAIVEGLRRTGATVFPGMPVFFQHLAELAGASEIPSLRLCISAGAALDRKVADRFRERFGVKVHVFYGSSECGGIAYDATPEPVALDGFVGKPMRGVTITPGDAGAIEVRSAAVGDGYFPNDEPDVLGDGRFIPGDLIEQSADGLVLAGRISDLINVAGRKLNPAEIEHRLAECPGVRQVVVFGAASARRGEEPVACLVAEEGIDAAAVARFCQRTLSAWQRPRHFWIVPEIPVNERGKISRRALAERYAREQAR